MSTVVAQLALISSLFLLFFSFVGTNLLLNTLLKGYIIVKKQGDRTFHLTCLSENYSAVGANNNSCTDSTQGPGLDLSTYMIQTKQPQVKLYSNLSEFPNFLEIFGSFLRCKIDHIHVLF